VRHCHGDFGLLERWPLLWPLASVGCGVVMRALSMRPSRTCTHHDEEGGCSSGTLERVGHSPS
jgi:hypothetical protein